MENNNISLFNLIEKITFQVAAGQFKKVAEEGARGVVFPVELEVVTRYRRLDDTKADALDSRMRLLNPEGNVMLTHEQKVALKEGIKNLRMRTKFSTIPVEKTGTYWIAVDVKSVEDSSYTEVYRIPLEIVLNVVEEKEGEKK